MPEVDLEAVIEDSVTDSETAEVAAEGQQDASAAPQDDASADPDTQVTTPNTAVTKGPEDAFAKEHGLPQPIPGQRENRIPYSRVQQISNNAVKKALEPVNAKLKAWEPLGTDPQRVISRLQEVDAFERIMTTDHRKFVQMLETVPAYKAIFDEMRGGQAQRTAVGAQQPQQPAVDPASVMPEPDQTLSDGSKVYSLDGLNKLLQWQASQVEQRITKQVAERYDPLRNEYEAYRQRQQLIPIVQRKIDEARQWPQFNENEVEIVKTLNQYPNWSLERAYQHVVIPKLRSDRESMRASLLEELKKAPPAATSAPAGRSKPGVQRTGGRSIEDIISAHADELDR